MLCRRSPDGGRALLESQILEYLVHGRAASANTLALVRQMDPNTMIALNLTHDWLASFLPHVLSKVDRVSFGLLHDVDARALGPQPTSRLLLAVPFVGKDVPSPAAEFAQPDVLIGTTTLAYRYEGLRLRDMRRIVRQLKIDFQSEAGPRAMRPTYELFEGWVEASCREKGVERSVVNLEVRY
jgi:hypothetical protein